MKEPKATQVPCTCEKGCFLYDEPVELISFYNERIIVQGFFIKRVYDGVKYKDYKCYIGDYTNPIHSDRIETNTDFEGFGEHVIEWDEDED